MNMTETYNIALLDIYGSGTLYKVTQATYDRILNHDITWDAVKIVALESIPIDGHFSEES